MKPLIASEIKGTWATLLLPINEDESIDFKRLADEIDHITASGVRGVYSNGTAGEFHNQTEAEFDRVSELLAEKCEAARMPFQIGASHMSPIISLERLRRAKLLKPSAIQVILPDWFPVIEEESIEFLNRLATEAAPIGLILYNPPHSKRVMTPTQLKLLSESVPGLIGVKVAAGPKSWFDELGPALPRLSVFTPGHHLATHIPFGSSGAYSNVACISPSRSQRWYRMILDDAATANDIQRRLLAFFDAHITPFITRDRYANAAVDKLLAAIGGWGDVGTKMRWPYRSIPESLVAPLSRIGREFVPELFSN